MFKKLFILSWIFSALGMFLLSYLWHGFVLLDFVKNGTPTGLTLFYKIIIYLIIGFVLTKAVGSKYFDKWFKYLPVLKGIAVGLICGFLVFLVSTFKGISLNVTLNKPYLILNFFWQIFEQAMGGIIVGIVHYFLFDPDDIPEEE